MHSHSKLVNRLYKNATFTYLPSFAKIYSLEFFLLVTNTQLRLLKVISVQNVCSQNVMYFLSLFLTSLPTHIQTNISQIIKRRVENYKEKLRRALLLSSLSLKTQYQPWNKRTLKFFFIAFKMSTKKVRSRHLSCCIKKGIL